MTNRTTGLLSAGLHAAAVAAACVQPAFAQDAPMLPPVEVVGTRLTRTDVATPSPVRIITADEIQSSGARTVQEALGAMPSVLNGSGMDLAGNGFSAGASTVAMRGLGVSSTLVLINGRRMTGAPYADPNPGRSTVYDLNAIPVEMVERIEVVLNGASAIYGSDAIAGAINIVLRKNFRGAEAGIRYSANGDGQFGNRRAHGVAGFGDWDKDGFSGFVGVTDSHRYRVSVPNTTRVAADDLRELASRGGNLSTLSYPPNYYRESVPGNGRFTTFVQRDARCPPESVLPNGRCFRDQWPMQETLPEQHGNTLFGGANFKLGAGLQLFSEFGFSRTKTRFSANPFAVLETGAVWFARDGSQKTFRFVLPAGHPDNPAAVPVAARYTFEDLGQIRYSVDTENTRLLVGLKGDAYGWDWESALSYARLTKVLVRRGFAHATALQNAINTLAYRPFGNNSPETLAAISPDLTEPATTTGIAWDVKGTRELMTLAGGPMALVAGAEVRQDRLTVNPDPLEVSGDIISVGSVEAHARRRAVSLYAELSAPFARQVETQIAVRLDRYSDYGSSFTPHAGIKWKPVDTMALRAALASGFRAPSLSQSGVSDVQAFATGLRDPLRCGKPGATTTDCSFSASTLVRGNPDVQPETSHSQTIGILLSPNKAFDLAIDAYRVSRNNTIAFSGTQTVLNERPNDPSVVLRDPDPASWLPGVPDSGPVQGIIRQFGNSGERTVTSGVETDAVLRGDFGAWGKLVTNLRGNYVHSLRVRDRLGQPYTEYAGRYQTPRFKGHLSATWTYRSLSMTGRINHVAGWRHGDSGTSCYSQDQAYLARYQCHVPSWTTVDLHLGYRLEKKAEFGFGVRNIGNKPAPYDPDFVTAGYNPHYHHAYGRYYSLWTRLKF